MNRWSRIASVLFASTLCCFAGCSKEPTAPRTDGDRWQRPETELTYAPLESDTTSFRVHLYWYGYDVDGQVVAFRFAIDSDTSKSPMLWHRTTDKDSIFTFTVRPGDQVGGHVFWICAQDDQGHLDPTPAKRYFSIRTLPPTSQITGGPVSGAATGPIVTFSWSGTDPDGGPVGDPAPTDSFEYVLLRPGTSFDGNHPPLPGLSFVQHWADFLSGATGPTLPAPNDDWKWMGTAAKSQSFGGLLPGGYVFAVRAVDAAGAHDTRMTFRNVRMFTVASSPDRQSPPRLTVSSEALLRPLTNDAGIIYGMIPVSLVETRLQLLDGDPVTFSWSGSPGIAGYSIAGYTSALDDTTTESWSNPALSNTSITLPPNLRPGRHYLFIRVVDVAGGSAIAVLALDVAHAAFRDPAQLPSILYVDDFAPPPGTWADALRGSPNFPTDAAEDDWWSRIILSPLAREHGMVFEQWDPVYLSTMSINGREPPSLAELARHRVVIWSLDFNNATSSHVGLWLSLHESSLASLRAYVRGGGTLILTGFSLAGSASANSSVPAQAFSRGMCASVPASDGNWLGEYFVRDYMGVDGAEPSDASSRRIGARDFVEARATPEATGLGFHAAEVDTGAAGTSAKWNPYVWGYTEMLLAPGLPKIEGWKIAPVFGCRPSESVYRRENPGAPIASPLFLYHGVNQGVLQDMGPSPREGLVVGIATQAHDNGTGDGSLVTPGNTRGVTGRMVFLGFPVYYLKDAQAYQVMRTAFEYVNGSPTLVGGTP